MREGLSHWPEGRGSAPLSSASLLSRLRRDSDEISRVKTRREAATLPSSNEPHALGNTFRFLDDMECNRPSVEEIEHAASRSSSLFDEIGAEVQYAAGVKGRVATEYWAGVVTAWKGLSTAAERRFSSPLGNLSRERRRILAGALMDVSKVTSENAGRAIAIVALWLEAHALIPIPKIKACSTMAATIIEGCIEATQ